MTSAWTAVGSIATVIALVVGTYSTIGVLAHEELTERATFDAAAIDRIDIRGDHGSIRVEGGDVEEVAVVADIDHGLRRTGHRIEVEGSTLVVRASCPRLTTWCRVDHRLVVPTDVAVHAGMQRGTITVRDVDGAVTVDGADGPVQLDRLGGDVRGGTRNGPVEATGLRSDVVDLRTRNGEVSLAFADAPTSVEARSRNGRVEVVVPAGPDAYDVRLDTRHGDTDIGVRTDPASDRSVTAETRNGSVTVRYPTG